MKIWSLCLIVISVLFFAACKKELDNTDGPEVQASLVLNEVCGKLSARQLLAMKPGEFSLAAKSMSVLSQPSQVVEGHALELLEITDRSCSTSDGRTVPCTENIFSERVMDLQNEEAFDFEQIVYLPKVEEEIAAQQTEKQESTIDQDICYLTQEMYERVGVKMTYHNYSMQKITKKIPVAVQERDGCSGFPNCEMNIVQVKFDQIFVSSSDRYRKNFTFEISHDVPYLSRIVKRCIIHSIPQHIDDNQNGRVDEGEVRIVPISECRDVVDFGY